MLMHPTHGQRKQVAATLPLRAVSRRSCFRMIRNDLHRLPMLNPKPSSCVNKRGMHDWKRFRQRVAKDRLIRNCKARKAPTLWAFQGYDIYGAPMTNPKSVCYTWGTVARSKVSVTNPSKTDAYWLHPPDTWPQLEPEVHSKGAQELSTKALGYVYDSIMVNASIHSNSKTRHLTEAKCLQFLQQNNQWCQTQRNQCDSYGTKQPYMNQMCAMKMFSDSQQAVEFNKCAPFYCWYKPCYTPLAKALIPLSVLARKKTVRGHASRKS